MLSDTEKRALIEEARAYAGVDEYGGAILLRELAAALGVLSPAHHRDRHSGDRTRFTFHDPAVGAMLHVVKEDAA